MNIERVIDINAIDPEIGYTDEYGDYKFDQKGTVYIDIDAIIAISTEERFYYTEISDTASKKWQEYTLITMNSGIKFATDVPAKNILTRIKNNY